MELRADLDLCEGNAVCVGLAPTVFALDDEEDHVVVLQVQPEEELLPRVRKAVERCPKAALSLRE